MSMDDGRKTRLSRKLVTQTKRKLFIYVIGTIVILFLLVKFGLPALINFSLFVSGNKNTLNAVQTNNDTPSFIAPPSLNPYATATNSAQINISGNGVKGQVIDLFLNNQLTSTKQVLDDGSFSFSNVILINGANTIQAKAKIGNKESDFSNKLSITFENKAPSLSVDSPSDGQTVSKDQNNITISGKTDPDVRVTVNDFWAIVKDDGSYTYSLSLQSGDNQIKVIATDQAGNKTEKDLKVTRSS